MVEREPNINLGTATILRRGLLAGSLANPSNIDFHRIGNSLGFSLDAPNVFNVSSGGSASINSDLSTSRSNQDIISISVLEDKIAALNRVAKG